MRASGWVTVGDEKYEFNPATDFGTLDWGRGVWTYDNTWFWGSGNCDLDGHAFGFNIGYGFGDNSAATENILFYFSVSEKIAIPTTIIASAGIKILENFSIPFSTPK